ncbi:MAG TPA: carboxypeptidase-like regulatory domain-containing protein, partial [Candidatus Brocadiales bacterium]|nr:carboxypeptidase-like regulatory domain-containing protein [Candidatus Brocadiales bacterium]
LALDNSGNPHITWDDNSSGNYEIYYAYWAGCHCSAGDSKGCISGVVTRADTGKLLARKTVILRGEIQGGSKVKRKIRTDDSGCYSFTNLEDGTYKIKVKKCKGGGARTMDINSGGKVNDVDFQCK